MIDIRNELYHISTEILGEEVRAAVASAMEKVSSALEVDITSELATISAGRYGADIRNAIYNALDKLSRATPTPTASDCVAGFTIPLMHGAAVSIGGETTVEEEE